MTTIAELKNQWLNLVTCDSKSQYSLIDPDSAFLRLLSPLSVQLRLVLILHERADNEQF